MNIGKCRFACAACNTACIRSAYGFFRGQTDGAVNGQVGNTARYITEQTLISCSRFRNNGKVVDLVLLTVKAAGISFGTVADGGPVVAGQVDICRQDCVDTRCSRVDGLCQPCQLSARADLIYALFILFGFCCGCAVPGIFRRLCQGDRLCQDAVSINIVLIGRTELHYAVLRNISQLCHRVFVLTEREILIDSVFIGSHCFSVGIGQREGKVLQRIPAVCCFHLQVIGDLPVNGNGDVCQAAQYILCTHSGEVRTHARIRHVIHRLERVRCGVHRAEDIAVGECVVHSILTFRKLQIFGDRQRDRYPIHLLILSQVSAEFGACAGVAQLVLCGVEYTGDLIDRAIQTVEGDGYAVAGHNGLVGVGNVFHMSSKLRRTHQRVRSACGVGHSDDDRAALCPCFAELQQINIVSAVLRRSEGFPFGKSALQRIIRNDSSIGNLNISAAADREVQLGSFVRIQVRPCIVVVIPFRTAVSFLGSVKGNMRHRGACCLIGDHEYIGAFGVCRGVEAAVAAIGIGSGINIQRVIIHRHDVGCGGLDIDPVILYVAAADRGNVGGIALQHLNIVVRFDHDVCRVRINDLPHTVCTDTGQFGYAALKARSRQEHLNIPFVSRFYLRTQLREVVGCLIGKLREGESLFRVCAALEPACLGHISIGGIRQTPCVIAVAFC